MATRKPRKLKFGSPAWQKKYNPAFKGGAKKKATKKAAKKSPRKTAKKSIVGGVQSKLSKRPGRLKLSKHPLRYEVRSALDLSVKIANLLRLNNKERAAIAAMVEARMPATGRAVRPAKRKY